MDQDIIKGFAANLRNMFQKYADSEFHLAPPFCRGNVNSMSEEQLSRLILALGPHWLEVIAWLAAAVMAIVAIYALVFALHQIRVTRDNTKALFLVELDRRWEGHEMKEARTAWRNLRNYVDEVVDTQYPQLNALERQKKRSETCAEQLYSIYSSDPEEYTTIISILGFFEMVGYIVDRGFISSKEIAELYGDSIMEFDRLCFNHIEKRREERRQSTGQPSDLYEHARNLIMRTREFYSQNQ